MASCITSCWSCWLPHPTPYTHMCRPSRGRGQQKCLLSVYTYGGVLRSEWVTSSCPPTCTSLGVWCSGGSIHNLPLINPEFKAKKRQSTTAQASSILNQWSQLNLCACMCLCLSVHVCVHSWLVPMYASPFRAIPIDCFVDHTRGGCQNNLMVSIDFVVSKSLSTTPALGTVRALWCIWPYIKVLLVIMLSFCCSHWCPHAQIGSL